MSPSGSTLLDSNPSKLGAGSQVPILSVSNLSLRLKRGYSFSANPYQSQSDVLDFVVGVFEAWNPEVDEVVECRFTDIPPRLRDLLSLLTLVMWLSYCGDSS